MRSVISSVFFVTHNFKALLADNIKSYSETAHLDAVFNEFSISVELSHTVLVRFSKAILTGSTSVACFTITDHNQTRAVVAIHEYFLTSLKLSDNFFVFLETLSNSFDALSVALIKTSISFFFAII
jgi:hypothetical protein